MSPGPDYHGWTHALKEVGGTDPPPPYGRFIFLIFPSIDPVVVEDNAAGVFLVIPQDLDKKKLIHAHAGVYTVGGSATNLQVRNVTQAVDMLTDPIIIDSGENTSYTSGTPPDISTTNDDVFVGDIIVCDVDAAGSGAMGLDLILAFA